MTLSAKIAAAEALFGREEQTAARTVTAVATSDSEDGLITISFGPEDEAVEEGEDNRIGCIGSVRQGEEVNVIIQNGDAVVIGSAGWGDSLQAGVQAIDDSVHTLEELAENTGVWIRPEEFGLHLGKVEDPFEALLSNYRLSFLANNTEVAYIGKEDIQNPDDMAYLLFIEKAKVNGMMQFGDFAFIPRADGSMYLSWVRED